MERGIRFLFNTAICFLLVIRTDFLPTPFLSSRLISLGFDCSSPRVCCGTDIDRFCCIPPTSSSSSSVMDESNLVESSPYAPPRWVFFHIGVVALSFVFLILITVIIYQCLRSLHRRKEHRDNNKVITPIQLPVPSTSPLLTNPHLHHSHHRIVSNRISTISSATSDIRSRCTDTSLVLTAPLNLYPTNPNATPSRSSTSTSSSYYIFPTEFEQLC